MCSWVCVSVFPRFPPGREEASLFVRMLPNGFWLLNTKCFWLGKVLVVFCFLFFADTVPVNGVLLLTAHLNGFLVFCSRIYKLGAKNFVEMNECVCVCVRKCICVHLDRATNVAASLLFWSFVVMCQPRNRVPQQQQ